MHLEILYALNRLITRRFNKRNVLSLCCDILTWQCFSSYLHLCTWLMCFLSKGLSVRSSLTFCFCFVFLISVCILWEPNLWPWCCLVCSTSWIRNTLLQVLGNLWVIWYESIYFSQNHTGMCTGFLLEHNLEPTENYASFFLQDFNKTQTRICIF